MTDDPRRKSTRLRLNIIVEFDDGERVVGTFCRNISSKGFFLESADRVAVGRHIKITFRLPKRNVALCLEGVVRWQQTEASHDSAPGFGIEFLGLTNDQAESLRQELDDFQQAE